MDAVANDFDFYNPGISQGADPNGVFHVFDSYCDGGYDVAESIYWRCDQRKYGLAEKLEENVMSC